MSMSATMDAKKLRIESILCFRNGNKGGRRNNQIKSLAIIYLFRIVL